MGGRYIVARITCSERGGPFTAYAINRHLNASRREQDYRLSTLICSATAVAMPWLMLGMIHVQFRTGSAIARSSILYDTPSLR
jgi:hypothetical protein